MNDMNGEQLMAEVMSVEEMEGASPVDFRLELHITSLGKKYPGVALYAYGTHGRHSVLAGQEKRIFVTGWETREAGLLACEEAHTLYNEFEYVDQVSHMDENYLNDPEV